MTESEQPPVDKPDKADATSAASLVLVNTGDGKGKSTAAFGTVLRAVAMGWKVAVVQFLKSGGWRVGEEKICGELGVDWFAEGDGFTWDAESLDESAALAKAAWDRASELISAGDHRLVVLDEISYALSWGWVPTEDVVDVIVGRPETTSVILTGRDMAAEIIEIADTVTEMRKVKHAFDRGIVAKKGIDY